MIYLSNKWGAVHIEIREVESVLFTLNNEKELYKVIHECKDIIEKRGLIRSDQSFREMTKIILIKMNEERRVKAKEGNNRFLIDVISRMAKANDTDELTILGQLFDEAQTKYPNIYTNENETVLDNCMGSGSTGVACVNTNRNFIGIEKEEKYFNIAKERIKKASNISFF